MENNVRIEDLYEEGKMGPAKAIFEKEGIALAAVGSPACVRSLYFTAKEMGRLDFLFWRALTARDYSLGKHEKAIRECVQEALGHPEVQGVIIYASCMDILAGWDVDAIIDSLDNPEDIPVEVLYRGPLAKRKCPPMEALEKIWSTWGLEEISCKSEKGVLEKTGQSKNVPVKVPPEPDFETIITKLQSEDCDILLLTPGGCKSCMNCQKEKTFLHVKNTRFADVAVWNCNIENLVGLILEYFPEERPLYLLGSAVMESIGFDAETLCLLLRDKGKEAVYLKSNGFSEIKVCVFEPSPESAE